MRLASILLATVCCVLGRAQSAKEGQADHLQDAHLVGGSPVDPQIPQPFVGDLMLKRQQESITKICEATLVKQTNRFAYFLTAAECFDEKK